MCGGGEVTVLTVALVGRVASLTSGERRAVGCRGVESCVA